jgi:hypothetical protein
MSGKEDSLSRGCFLLITATVAIAMNVDAKPNDKAIISLVETGGVSHVARLKIKAIVTHAFGTDSSQ